MRRVPSGEHTCVAASVGECGVVDSNQTVASSLQKASPNSRIGGPATAGCDTHWIGNLTELASTKKLPLDFISCHAYGGGGDESQVGVVSSLMGGLAQAKKLAQGKPLVLSEWSSSWSFTIPYHDMPASAPFIVQSVAAMDGIVDISSYWTFSDVFEEGGMLPGPCHGGFGLLNVHGTPKPAYRAFQLLHGAGEQRLQL